MRYLIFRKIWCWLALTGMYSAAADCPCAWNSADNSIDCQERNLKTVPHECFNAYPSALQVSLSNNHLKTLYEHDFEGLSSLTNLSIDNNLLSTLHSKTFHSLTRLSSLSLNHNQLEILPDNLLQAQDSLQFFSVSDNLLIKLPNLLFSENLVNPLTVDLRGNRLRVIPCSTVQNLPASSSISVDEGIAIWAKQMSDVSKCSQIPLEAIVSECMPVNITAQDIDCGDFPQTFSPLLSVLAASEGQAIYSSTERIIFKAELDDLIGNPPTQFDCLPEGLDVTNDFAMYHQYIEDLKIETLYFDLADLAIHTSKLTKSVTVYADTVVLSRPLPPVHYYLTIGARQVILAHPLHVAASCTVYPPADNETFYELQISAGTINNLKAIQFIHGLVSIAVLDGENIIKPHYCQELPVISNDLALQWVSSTQLWLNLYCGVVLKESGKAEDLIMAKNLTTFIVHLTTNWTQADMIGTNQMGNKLLKSLDATLSGMVIPHNVPYLSISVYADMIPYLASNIALYKEAHDRLRQKMIVNAERLFDMNIHFEERMDDLEFLQSNAERAIEMAETVHSAHSNQLENHISWATTTWEAIMDINSNVLRTKVEVEEAIQRVEEGIEAYKRRQRFVAFLNVGSLFYGCISGGLILDVMSTVSEAFKFKNYEESIEEITEKMESVNVMMIKVQELLVTVPPVPPPGGDQGGWLLTFNDSSALFSIASQAALSADYWESISIFALQSLGDEEFSDKIDGVKNLRMKINEFSVWCQALSEQIQAFCEYVASVLDEANNVMNDASAVENSKNSLDMVNQMLANQALTEENYRQYIIEQNLGFLQIMLQMFLKSRSDILAINMILSEYCRAYFYSFFKDCDLSNRPSFWDNYDEVLYKLNNVQFESLNSISSLNPPPQPFQKYIVVEDSAGCVEGIATSSEVRCPVSALGENGHTSFNIADYWGPGLSYAARIRVDKLRIYLQGLNESTVTINVKRPAIFNDTYQGNEEIFRGHLQDCRVIYEDTAMVDVAQANYVTDCSTDTYFQEYVYRTSPDGRFTFVWDGYHPGVNYTGLRTLQLYLEGSLIPNI